MESNKSSQQNNVERKTYDVFISYRRSSLETARNLEQALKLRGLKVFFDMEELDDGKFNEKLYEAIDQSKNAIFLMTKGALDGCEREGDWVRNELERVMKQDVNLILVRPSDVELSFPDGLPPSLSGMRYIEVTELHPGKLFPASVGMVVKRLKGVKADNRKDDDDIPTLGKPKDEVAMSGLKGQDAQHFKKALGYYNVVRYRSALAELEKIVAQENPFVKYYALLIRYILEGDVEDRVFEEACCTARDLGCTDAMRIFADRHLPSSTKPFDPVPPSECIGWLKRAIADGDAAALAGLGSAYENGSGIVKDLVKARELYKLSFKAGDLVGKIAYGQDCLCGNAGERDLSEAGDVLRPVISHLRKYEDELTSGEYLTLMIWYSLLNGNVVKENPVLVEKYAKLSIESKGRSIAAGDYSEKGWAYFFLGAMFARNADGRAFECLQKACDLIGGTEGSAEWGLAKCFDEGIGVDKNEEKAIEYYERAVELGNPAARCVRALQLVDSDEEQDFERGKILLKWAAEGGDSDAEWVYGSWLIGGVHFEANIPEGMKWLEKAVRDNNAGAMNALGQQYRDGNEVVSIDHVKAFKLFEQGALGGSADAMNSLGFAYLNGQGVTRNVGAAEKWFTRAAKSGDADAECSLGTRFFNGEFGERNVEEAIKWWKKAAEHGDVVAMSNIGMVYRDGDGVDKNIAKALEWYERAANAGNADAACTLGANYYNGVFGEPDKKKALEWSLKAAKLGDATAMNNLGAAYRDGDGVDVDLRRAVDWFHFAADNGHPGAMTNLGFAYLKGEGVSKDEKIAEEWFVKAAETGDADAEVSLGTRYAQGAFGKVDYPKAIEWWLKAAQHGQMVAMWNLGDVYQRGEEGVEKDLRKSFDWFKAGAEAGLPEAMESLGLAYLGGLGTIAEPEKAREWLIRAAEYGNASAEWVLGALYARDDYWDKDIAEAIKWWEKAAGHGDARAMRDLGCVDSDPDLKEDGIQLDLDKARGWFRQADENGCEDAAYFLGLDVLGSLGKWYETYVDWQADFQKVHPEKGPTARLLRKAGSWFQKPLDIQTDNSNLAGACLRWLARIARYQENVEAAKELYRKAAEKGDEKAKVELAEIDAGDHAAAGMASAEKEVPPSSPVTQQTDAASATSVPKFHEVSSIPAAQPVSAPIGDEASRAEALFLRKARRFKKNDGRIDKDEKSELRELAEELGISSIRREELIEQVEEEFESAT